VQHVQVVGHKTRRVSHRGRHAFRVMQRPDVVTVRRAEVEAGPVRQIGRAGRPSHAGDQVRTGDQTMHALVQLAHDQIGLFQRRLADADRQVEALADDVHPATGAVQLHVQIWIQGHEADDQTAHLIGQQARRAGDADRAARLGPGAVDQGLRRLGLDQHGETVLIIGQPDLCDREFA